eukprot:CAMPEP_0202482616 /NCGR_PEP_ID=MMETSP1361-20130828/2012_1 /ASSEMBLY_ACC=CAM_ASM_000849 /TAXON_ID=210615 /ORGANISM="Staurosira complex sp., Strain CCMP2646" /LENGTH=416 /DNA_ID=CAMNT_0049110573 /DNA_START=204 /DNA_END=1454 /DNA_ORIENTATION=-
MAITCLVVDAFVGIVPLRHTTRLVHEPLFMIQKDVTIPLLDLSDSDLANEVITPLPSFHLPSELSTLHLYGMELRRPVHKMLIEHIVQEQVQGQERMYGFIVDKPNKDSLVGAIGCTAETLLEAHPENTNENNSDVGNDDSPLVVLSRGSYRFVVKEITKTFPYPVAIVNELVDDEPEDTANADIYDDENILYQDLDTATHLVRRIMVGLKTLIDQKLQERKPELTPLEISILQESGAPVPPVNADEQQAEEMAAVFDIFQSSLMDIAPVPVDRYYAVAMLAAEMANVDNEVRRELLTMTNGVERMRIVLQEIEEAISMNQARTVAGSITDELDEDDKDLKVGEPQLPPWIKGIRDGTRLEYFWSEEDGWCGGVVDGEPIKVLDEVIVTVRFDDGETHKLPITPDEKVRWRPPKRE